MSNQTEKEDLARIIATHPAFADVILDVKQDLFLRWVRGDDKQREEIASWMIALDLVTGKISQIYANSEDIN